MPSACSSVTGCLSASSAMPAMNAPLYIYVSRWFDRRRGTALALLGSGSSVSAAIWAPIFAAAEAQIGWRNTMLCFAAIEVALILPAAALMLGPAPEPRCRRRHHRPTPGGAGARVTPGDCAVDAGRRRFLLLRADGDAARPSCRSLQRCRHLGIASARRCSRCCSAFAFFSRQVWGLVADRIGGLRTILAGSVCQIVAMVGFLATQSEAGLFTVSAVFGLGFSGIIPAYVLAVRELFPASEASWRVPTLLLFSGSGMAFGGWLAGAIYDYAGFYAIAFAAGILFNLVNLALIGVLVWRQRSRTSLAPAYAAE